MGMGVDLFFLKPIMVSSTNRIHTTLHAPVYNKFQWDKTKLQVSEQIHLLYMPQGRPRTNSMHVLRLFYNET